MGELRVYTPAECGSGGYPLAWHESIKHAVRAEAGNRCVRCGHPYVVGQSGVFEESDELHPRRTERDTGFTQAALDAVFEERAEELSDPQGARRTNWSPCDGRCRHGGPVRYSLVGQSGWTLYDGPDETVVGDADLIQAAWRILTVHHLDGDKRNCRWWNLAALCQRDHLTIQGKVRMDRRWLHEHSDWFKPYVAGYYAAVYLGEELTREQAIARQDELLALEHRQEALAL